MYYSSLKRQSVSLVKGHLIIAGKPSSSLPKLQAPAWVPLEPGALMGEDDAPLGPRSFHAGPPDVKKIKMAGFMNLSPATYPSPDVPTSRSPYSFEDN